MYDRLEEVKINYWDMHRSHLKPLVENGLVDGDTVAYFRREFLDPANLLLRFGHIPEVPASVSFAKVAFRIALPFDDLAVERLLLPELLAIPQVDQETYGYITQLPRACTYLNLCARC